MNKNNYCVIMAGGIGSRFWPASRNNCPKQFLDFFGTGRSLIQMTFDRFRPMVPAENIIIASNEQYRDLILEQLPEIRPEQILMEPARRNTAPCIAYAIAHIKALTDRANIVIAASDHLITNEAEFTRVITEGLHYVENHDCLLTLGMKPTRPETGYGYIQRTEGADSIHDVKNFTEKPNHELAEKFLESGDFLWNSGMFLWNLQTIDRAFQDLLPDIQAVFDKGKAAFGTPNELQFIRENFASCPSISVDYGIMEKASNVKVMEADFGWSDLGTWGSLYELSDKDENRNVSLKSQAMFYEAHNNIVSLEPGKIAIIQGLDDYIVTESQGVLLICRKHDEQQIKQFNAEVPEEFK